MNLTNDELLDFIKAKVDNNPVIPSRDDLNHYIKDHHERAKLGILQDIFFNAVKSKLGDSLSTIENALDFDPEKIENMAGQIEDLLKDEEFSHWTSALESVYDEAKKEIVEKVASSIDNVYRIQNLKFYRNVVDFE